MKLILLLLSAVMYFECLAVGQTGDLGAQIEAADAALGANPGVINVTASGTISEGKVSLSVGHDLVCSNQVTISLDAGSYLYQNSHTRIKNCIISSTSAAITGEVQSIDTDHVELDGVTFEGGGNLVYWDTVSDFLISDNKVVSITAFDPVTNKTQNGYYLLNCSYGAVNNLKASDFVFPTGPASIPAIIQLNLSSNITVNNIFINNVDASYTFGGSGIQINGSKHITVNGGVITNNPKMDGITTESFQMTPIYPFDITITGVNASYNGGPGLNTGAGLSLGDGIDVINSRHVRISNCTLLGNGYLRNEQPAIWLFLDDDVIVANSNMSDGSMGGLDIAGSVNVVLINDTINRNQAGGTFAEFQAGQATSVGPNVAFVTGVSGGFGLSWEPGTPFILDGITYNIASVTDSGHIILTTSPPNHSSPVSWAVNTTNLQILNSIINDNGMAGFGGQLQVGIDWVDGTAGVISGVTSTNTGVGAQLFGLELDNTASAALSGDSFSGNSRGGDGIYATPQGILPASLSFPSQGVTTKSSTQTVTLTAGAVVLQSLLIQVSGDFSETNDCGPQLPAYATCQIQLTFVPTAVGSRSGTLTITDAAPRSPQTVSLTGTGIPHALGLGVGSGSSASLTVEPGNTAQYSLSIGGEGISGNAALSCAVVPAGLTCNVPATVAISAAQATTFTVNVLTPVPTLGRSRPIAGRLPRWLWGLSITGWVVLPAGLAVKRSSGRRFLWLPLFLLLFLCSCGEVNPTGGGNTKIPPQPAARNYIVTVTATLGSVSEQVPLKLTVQ